MIRHGDRSPVNFIPHDEQTWDCDDLAVQTETKVGAGKIAPIEVSYNISEKSSIWQGSCYSGISYIHLHARTTYFQGNLPAS